ncbi:MAG: hybrid sensor histidine kinase/response regulator [Elusimicrobia bacterium]|nr:hybrid sensor histidine kinase/response regulator [Elusimicrobiota bacterium]
MSQEALKILVIEDDPEYVEIIRLCLDEPDSMGMKFKITHADRLDAGLELLESGSFDALLLDLVLPDSRGIETMHRISARGPQIPILVTTNMGDESLAFEAMRLGAQDYMVKATSDSRLLKRSIWYAVERHRLQRQSMEELRKLEQLKAEIKEQRKMDQLKDDLIGTVSHELRTPLSIAMGGVDNLGEGLLGALSGQQKETLALVGRNLSRLARMINNLLDISRLESGRARASRTTLDLKPLFEEVLAGLRLSRDELAGRIEIRCETPHELAKVHADGELISEVLGNLLDNALRFAASSVILKATPAGAPAGVLVEVIDDGPGIPAEMLADLFNKFVQINRPKGGSGYRGTGLGLAICKEILELHECAIGVDSSPGKGCRFYFRLPLFAPEKSQTDPAVSGGRS